MKIFMLVIDGVSYDPLSELDGRTPLETAVTPYIDYLASHGQTGSIQTAFEGYPIESLICVMGLLGYDPRKYYPNGRASFEAIARGISIGENDLIFRCNIIKTAKDRKSITDFTAGMISGACAKKILSEIKLPSPTWELHPGQSYRNLLVVRQTPVKASEIKLFEPHMHHDEPMEGLLPVATTRQAQTLASDLREFMLSSHEQIASMDIAPLCEGNMLWLWSPSSKPRLPSFKSLYGISGAVVAELDFMHGLAMAADMRSEVIPETDGCADSNYPALAETTIKMFDKYDFVLTHVNAADEAAHIRDAAKKIAAVESVDRYVLEPVFCRLRESHPKNFAVIVCGDHKTRCSDGKHIGDPVPFLFYLDGSPRGGRKLFTEKAVSYRQVSPLGFLKEALKNGI